MSYLNCAKKIVQKIQKEGYISYFAGGWVRDYLMDRPSDDIDIATEADVETIRKLFPKTIPVGIAFGIVIVVEEGHHFEIATFRREREYTDGRRPSVIEPATPEEDAERRDFTINGLFFDPTTETLYDYVDGKKDIERGLVRAIGDPILRFTEDKLRMIRAVRYSARFQFAIDDATLAVIMKMADTLFPSVAIERVCDEIRKMSLFPHFAEAISLLHKWGLLPQIFPQLPPLTPEEIHRCLRHTDSYPQDAPFITKLLPLFSSMTRNEALHLCKTLKRSKQETAFILLLIRANKIEHLSTDDRISLFADEHIETCLAILQLDHPDPSFLHRMHREMENHRPAILRKKQKTTLLKADDLLSYGIPPSKELGRLLHIAESIAIENHLDDKTALIELLRNHPDFHFYR